MRSFLSAMVALLVFLIASLGLGTLLTALVGNALDWVFPELPAGWKEAAYEGTVVSLDGDPRPNGPPWAILETRDGKKIRMLRNESMDGARTAPEVGDHVIKHAGQTVAHCRTSAGEVKEINPVFGLGRGLLLLAFWLASCVVCAVVMVPLGWRRWKERNPG